MLSLKSLSLAVCAATVLSLTGCVVPLACGPHGHQGPIVLGSSCDGCGACDGCGEMYIDPWINHPPSACDSCDHCGNYSGQSCGSCRSVFDGFATLWGYRCDPPCNGCGVGACDGGCDAIVVDAGCGAGCSGCATCGIEPGCGIPPGLPATCGIEPGEVVSRVTVSPTPARTIVEAVPAEVQYEPSRQRKIFRPRASIAVTPGQVR